MQVPWNMYQLELEELDANNPSVDRSTWLNVRVVEHPFNITSIDFDLKIFDTNDVKLVSLKGTPETIYLNLGLGVVQFLFIPSDRTTAAQVSLVICTKLRENETSGNARQVDSQNDTSVHMIVNRPKAGGHDDRLFEILHRCFLVHAPDKLHVLLCQENEGLHASCKVFDPNPDNDTYA